MTERHSVSPARDRHPRPRRERHDDSRSPDRESQRPRPLQSGLSRKTTRQEGESGTSRRDIRTERHSPSFDEERYSRNRRVECDDSASPHGEPQKSLSQQSGPSRKTVRQGEDRGTQGTPEPSNPGRDGGNTRRASGTSRTELREEPAASRQTNRVERRSQPQTTKGYPGIRGGGGTTQRPHTGNPRSPLHNSPGLVERRPGRRRTREPRNWASPATRGRTGITPAAQAVRPELSCGRNPIPADRLTEQSAAVYP